MKWFMVVLSITPEPDVEKAVDIIKNAENRKSITSNS